MRYRSKINWNNPVELDRDIATQYGVAAAYPGKGYGSQRLFDLRGKYHGTLTNVPAWTRGKFGEPAISYSQASAQYTSIPVSFTADNVTLLAWTKPATFQTNIADPDYTVNSILTANGEKCRLYFQREGVLAGGNPRVRGYILSSSSAIAIAVGATTLTAGEWYHVAYTYDGATGRVYLNGAQDGSTAGSGAIDDATSFRIGSDDYSTTSQEFDGIISQPIICNRALTANQIAELYRNPFLLYWQPSPVRTFWMGAAPAAGGGLSIPIAAYHYNHSLRA